MSFPETLNIIRSKRRFQEQKQVAHYVQEDVEEGSTPPPVLCWNETQERTRTIKVTNKTLYETQAAAEAAMYASDTRTFGVGTVTTTDIERANAAGWYYLIETVDVYGAWSAVS